jgi:hypothetical protein
MPSLYYGPAVMLVTTRLTLAIDKVGAEACELAKDTCRAIEKQKLQLWPDFAAAVALENATAPLGNSKFAVTLNHRLLVSVNAENTSTLPELVTAAAGIATAATPLVALSGEPETKSPALPACTAGPRQVSGK